MKMRLSKSVKPVSFFKAHASEVIREVVTSGETIVITQNGEARVVVQGVQEYDQMQESLALLKLLVQSKKSIDAGRVKPSSKSFSDLRAKVKELHKS
jgi:prevent-host-death family protein